MVKGILITGVLLVIGGVAFVVAEPSSVQAALFVNESEGYELEYAKHWRVDDAETSTGFSSPSGRAEGRVRVTQDIRISNKVGRKEFLAELVEKNDLEPGQIVERFEGKDDGYEMEGILIGEKKSRSFREVGIFSNGSMYVLRTNLREDASSRDHEAVNIMLNSFTAP